MGKRRVVLVIEQENRAGAYMKMTFTSRGPLNPVLMDRCSRDRAVALRLARRACASRSFDALSAHTPSVNHS